MMNKDNTHVITRAVIINHGHILLCKTVDMPNNFYFLPGGHVEHGESAIGALHREMIEETGFNITIKRFLGCLENVFDNTDSCKCHNHEYNFIFEVEGENLDIHSVIPKLEAHIDVQWMPLDKLTDINFKPAVLRKLLPQWLALDVHGAFESIL